MYKYTALILSLAVVYATWSHSFVSSGLDNVKCKDKGEAMETAALSSAFHEGKSRIMHTSGVSNSFSGFHKKGYTVIVEGDYDNLKENDFVVYGYNNGLVLHRLRIKTDEGWIIEGDGNNGPDRVLVTKDNLIGIVLDKKIYRY